MHSALRDFYLAHAGVYCKTSVDLGMRISNKIGESTALEILLEITKLHKFWN